jgi:hypothetical protein
VPGGSVITGPARGGLGRVWRGAQTVVSFLGCHGISTKVCRHSPKLTLSPSCHSAACCPARRLCAAASCLSVAPVSTVPGGSPQLSAPKTHAKSTACLQSTDQGAPGCAVWFPRCRPQGRGCAGLGTSGAAAQKPRLALSAGLLCAKRVPASFLWAPVTKARACGASRGGGEQYPGLKKQVPKPGQNCTRMSTLTP